MGLLFLHHTIFAILLSIYCNKRYDSAPRSLNFKGHFGGPWAVDKKVKQLCRQVATSKREGERQRKVWS